MAYTNAATAIWPVFGSSNQLLAALALLVVSTWLLNRGGSMPWFTLAPAGFMMATTLFSLIILIQKHWAAGSMLLVGAEILLIGLALGVIALAVRTYSRTRTSAEGAPATTTGGG